MLELGAGTGLPSLICAHLDAKLVVITDYPDTELIENIHYNISHCKGLKDKSHIHAEVGISHSYHAVGRLTIQSRATFGDNQRLN